MNRTHVLIGAMAAIILLLAGALLYLLGRQPSAATPVNVAAASSEPADSSAPAARETAVAPDAPDPDSDAALSRWIVGGWAESSTNCETDTGEYYDARGRWAATGQEGRWRIEGARLIVTITHESVGDPMLDDSMRALPRPRTDVFPLTRDGADRMTLVVEGRATAMMRCPEARYSFST